ncbi:MAG: agmatine deiminase family protein [Bacteroidetes bacterium]|nr:agmatine deiminase family protein [Bacteroidota bacterium]
MIANVSAVLAQHNWHVKPTQNEIEYRKAHPKIQPISTAKTTSTYTMPSGANIPGEFEESQAVAIAWVYDAGGPDVTDEYAVLWAKMADAIQKECPVWIRIETGADSNIIKTYMNSMGMPLTNYKFYIMAGDAFWTRDYGPLGFYYGANDDLGFLDMQYYPGRDNDDKFPEQLATQLGITNVKTSLYAEGGNFVTDGFKNTFHSDVVEDINNIGTSYGPAHGAWPSTQTKDTMKYVWTSTNDMMLPTLHCDGGTGHIDMYLKLMDENTFALMEYPSIVNAQDKTIIQNVITMLNSRKNVYNKAYRIIKMPMPTQNNGDTLKTCTAIDADARTYVNGLTVNKTYLMPVFSNNATGNKTQDAAAIKSFQDNFPGYNVVPIDSRVLTLGGGAIHCVTMQIPADNPIRFWHPPIQDEQPLQSKYHIVAQVTNKSGIASATCYWRPKWTSTSWNAVTLTDSAGYKIGDITGSFNYMQSIEYYISATSNNGKTMTKPIVAPTGGYYTFYFPFPAGVEKFDPARNFALNPLPNPTNGQFIIPVSFEKDVNIDATVTDMLGKTIQTIDFGKKENGMNKLEFDLTNAAEGMYFIQIKANGHIIDTKKVMKH